MVYLDKILCAVQSFGKTALAFRLDLRLKVRKSGKLTILWALVLDHCEFGQKLVLMLRTKKE